VGTFFIQSCVCRLLFNFQVHSHVEKLLNHACVSERDLVFSGFPVCTPDESFGAFSPPIAEAIK
jgi:hypothetical protein